MKKGIGTVISTLAGAAAGAAAVGTSSNKKLKRKDEGLKKFMSFIWLLTNGLEFGRKARHL